MTTTNNQPWKSTYYSLTEKLDKAFKLMNEKGINAKQRHTCCSSCGIAEFKEDEQFAFYHEQGFDNMIESGSVFLTWQVDNINDIYDSLKEADLMYEHDGTSEKTIEVYQSRTYEAPNFSLKEQYELFPPLETKENLLQYWSETLAEPEHFDLYDIAFAIGEITRLGFDDLVKDVKNHLMDLQSELDEEEIIEAQGEAEGSTTH